MFSDPALRQVCVCGVPNRLGDCWWNYVCDGVDRRRAEYKVTTGRLSGEFLLFTDAIFIHTKISLRRAPNPQNCKKC